MKVEWTDHALEQLWGIHEYIAKNSYEYAQRTVDRITHRSKQISAFPLSGRIAPEYQNPNIREIVEGQYRIIYYIRKDQIDVLSVIHGRQQFLWNQDEQDDE